MDRYGFDILKPTKNKHYPLYQKEQIINQVLLNKETTQSVSVDEGLPSEEMLHTWVKKYKENGYNIVERKRGRSTMPKLTKKKENETLEEENKRLKEKNYKTIDELIITIDDYITYYNYDRIKEKLKGLSPVNYRPQSFNYKLFINCPIFGVQFNR